MAMRKNINRDSYFVVDLGIFCIEAEFWNFPTKYPSETPLIKIFNQQIIIVSHEKKGKFEKWHGVKRTKIDPQQ